MADFAEEIRQFLGSFSPEETAVMRQGFRVILDGQPATVPELPTALGLPAAVVKAALGRLTERGIIVVEPETEQIIGARGLCLSGTSHCLTLEGRRLYAFCAVDAIGIPVALRADATVESRCHHCRAALTVHLRGGAVVHAPEGMVIWAVERDWSRSLRAYT